jgi:hypothetical protein
MISLPHSLHGLACRHSALGFGLESLDGFLTVERARFAFAIPSGVDARHFAEQDRLQKRFLASCDMAGMIISPHDSHGLGMAASSPVESGG